MERNRRGTVEGLSGSWWCGRVWRIIALGDKFCVGGRDDRDSEKWCSTTIQISKTIWGRDLGREVSVLGILIRSDEKFAGRGTLRDSMIVLEIKR